MPQINFTETYGGKIFMNAFSVLVPADPANKLTALMEVSHKNKVLGVAEIVAVRSLLMKDIRDVLAYIESGRAAFQLSTELKKKDPGLTAESPLNHLVLLYLERNINNTQPLINEWWSNIKNQYPETHE